MTNEDNMGLNRNQSLIYPNEFHDIHDYNTYKGNSSNPDDSELRLPNDFPLICFLVGDYHSA